MRLILTLEYDGTPFRGWAAQPGLPTVEGALRAALAETFAVGREPRGRRPHRHRRPRARPGRVGRRRRRPAARNASRLRSTRACPTRSPSRRPPWRRADFHARHSARSRSYRYRLFTRDDAVAVRDSPQLVGAAPARRGRALRGGCGDRRRARLPRLHADADAARGLRPHRRAGGVDPARRPPRLRDHRRQLPPPHGAEPRRDDARGAGDDRRPARRDGRARRPGRPRRRGGSTSSPLPTISRSEISHHPLRSRRHRHRLRRDHPRVDAARDARGARPSSTPTRSSCRRSAARASRRRWTRSRPSTPSASSTSTARTTSRSTTTLEACVGMEDVLVRCTRRAARSAIVTAKWRAPRSSPSRPSRFRPPLRDDRRRRRDGEAQARSRAAPARRRAPRRRPGDDRVRRRLAVRHARGEGGRDVRRRRHVGSHPRPLAPRGRGAGRDRRHRRGAACRPLILKSRAAELRDILNRALVAYHVEDAPIMEDAAYDALYDELVATRGGASRARRCPTRRPTASAGCRTASRRSSTSSRWARSRR